jgi:UDP-2,4-diacetamido-2,4,6-trideoxy-beta-L-altropyranose hydrolase
MKVVFRADASQAIGTGHVMRCLALADAIVAGGVGRCAFVMRALAGHLGDYVAARGHHVTMLPAPPADQVPATPADPHRAWLECSPAQDAAETIAAVGEGTDWLVVDHYALDAGWEGQLRAHVGRIAVIDDLADRAHDCDLLLDQNLQGAPDRYAGLVPAGCDQLLGPRFALLRPEFGAIRRTPADVVEAAPPRVLVFLGGVDAPNATEPALAALAEARTLGLAADVVIGHGNRQGEALRQWCAAHSWITVHGGDTDLAALMAGATVAIGAGGTTAWERCALRLPSVLVQIADNQRPGCLALSRAGAALFAGQVDHGLRDRLAAMLATLLHDAGLRAHIADRAGELVDGRGVARVVARLAAAPPSLRRAVAADGDSVFGWRNAEETRRHFRDPRPIAAADHARWFDRVLTDADTDLLIGEDRGMPVGVLRFDHDGAGAEVSVYLVPGRSGRGEGTRLLRAGLDWLRAERPETAVVEAEVLAANAGSHAAFRAAGFQPFVATYRYHLAGDAA